MEEGCHAVAAGNTGENASNGQTVNNQLGLLLVKIAVFCTNNIASLSAYRIPAIQIFRQVLQLAFNFINLNLGAFAVLLNN